jgi:hypothetical protein
MAWALAAALALSPAGAQEPAKPWHLEFHDNYGAEGFTAVVKLDPGLSVITLISHEQGHPTHEVGRRTLTPEENEIVKNAIVRFASAGLDPIYSNPNVSDGYQMRVAFVASDGREGGVQVENVAVPALNTLIATVSPLLPPTPTGRPALVPYSEPPGPETE